MATVNKDFRVKNGLVVEGTTGTIDGNAILTAASSTDDLTEGSNLYFTDERAQDAVATAISNGTHTNISISYDDGANSISFTGSTPIADTDDVPEGSTNLYFTNARALAAVQSSYESYADQAEADAISTANANTDNLIGDGTVDGTAGNTVTDRIATAVSDLVDSAPGALDTLNELAAALGDDASFSTTITTSIAEKVAKAGDTMTGFLTLSADPTNALHAATKQYVDAEVPDDTDGLSEGSTNLYFTDARAQSAIDGTNVSFTSVEVNSVAKQVAATVSLTNTNQTAAYSFAKADYRSAKFIVKAAYGTHTEVSEVLITLDTSDNIGITEYAVVSTNGSLIDITAGINGTNVELLVTAGTATTTVTVAGTLIA